MNFHFAPVQGHTDAPYRHFHHNLYGNDLKYYTPFIRLEGGELRKRDLKDFTGSLNDGFDNIPQIIFRDENELTALVDILKAYNASHIDLNMGCPFPLQTGHGRGAATIANENLVNSVVKVINENPDISFSIKMRLGLERPDEWQRMIPLINQTKISHIAVHPRISRQQYSGNLDFSQFEEILNQSSNPVVFNGDITTPARASEIISRFPRIAGIMIGRGLLARPSLLAEIIGGNEWSREKRIETMIQFHRQLLNHYESHLCGENQIISKIRPFWEFAEDEIGRKAWKAIKKAGNMAKYHSAVALIS